MDNTSDDIQGWLNTQNAGTQKPTTPTIDARIQTPDNNSLVHEYPKAANTEQGLDDIAGWLYDQSKQDAAKLSTVVGVAHDIPPDVAIRVLRMEQRTGLPPDLISRNILDIERETAKADFNAEDFRKHSPIVSQWMAENVNNAAAVKNDVPLMQTFENTAASIKANWQKSQLQDQLRLYDYHRYVLGDATPAQTARQELLQHELDTTSQQADALSGALPYALGQGAYFFGQGLNVLRETAKGAMVGGMAGAAVGAAAGAVAPPAEVATLPAGFLSGAIAGGAASATQYNYTMEAGNAAKEYAAMRDLNGNPYSDDVVRGAGAVVGVFNAALDLFGEAVIARIIPGFDEAMKAVGANPTKLVKNLLARPTFRDAMTDVAKKWGTGAITEATTEAIQEVAAILGRKGVEGVSGKEAEVDSNSVDFTGRVTSTFVDTLVGMLVSGVPVTGAKLWHVNRAVKDAKLQQDFISALHDTSDNAELRAALPEKFQELVGRMTQDGPIKDVQISPEAFQSYFQSKGADSFEAAREILGTDRPLRDAIESDGEFKIPTDVWAAKVAGTEAGKALRPDIRLGDHSLTERELKQFESVREQYAKELLDEMKRETSGQEQNVKIDELSRQVKAISDQLVQTGFDQRSADFQAQLFSAMANVFHKTDNIDPAQFLGRYGLSITRPLPASLAGQVNVDTNIDPLIDQVRTGKLPSEKEAMGPSLLDMLREVGVNDQGGELAARDINKQRKPGQRNIARADGMTLDDAARRAQELGYLPENTDYSPNALLAAIDKELAGNKQFSERQGNPALREKLAALRDLERYLSETGVDLQNTSNEDVRKILQGAQERVDKQAATLNQGDKSSAVVLTGKELGDFGDDVKAWRKAGLKAYAQLQHGDPVNNPSIGKVRFTGAGKDKLTHTGASILKWQMVAGLREIVARAALVQSIKAEGRNDRVVAFHWLETNVTVGDHTYKVGVHIAEDDVGNKFYNFNQDLSSWKQKYETPGFAQQFKAEGRGLEGSPEGATSGYKVAPTKDTINLGIINQQVNNDIRGQLSISADKKLSVSLFENANLSTFLHETGHAFLEMLTDVASMPEASDRTRGMLDTILQWGNVGGTTPEARLETWRAMSIDQRRNLHERFAEGFEVYLSEGKAPSVELQTAFSTFRSWLRDVYRKAMSYLSPSKINPDIRKVFDRILATDDEIAIAQNSQSWQELFGTPEEAGMHPRVFAAYRDTLARAHNDAVAKLDAELQQSWKREETAWWKTKRKEVEADVEKAVNEMPVYRALALLKKGTLPDGSPLPEGVTAFKLSKAALEDMYGEAVKGHETFDKLRKLGVYAADGGVHPDVAASIFGYNSGDALVTDLLNAPARKQVIADMATEKMRDMYPDPLTDGSVSAHAQAAINNDKRAEVLSIELAALKKKRAEVRRVVDAQNAVDAEAKAKASEKIPGRVELQAIRAAANRMIARRRLLDISPNSFRLAEARAARKAFEAATKKDWDTAYQQKRAQLMNHQLYMEARDAIDHADKIRDYMMTFTKTDKQSKIGLAGGGYLEQIMGYLDRYEFARVPGKQLEKRKALLAWVAEREAEGDTFSIPQALLNDAARINWREIPYEELVGVHDAVANIEHLAKLKNKLLASRDQADIEEMVDGAVASIAANNKMPLDPIEFASNWKKRFKHTISKWDAEHTKMEFLFTSLDGHQHLGPVWRALFQPLADAEADEIRRWRDASGKIAEIFSVYSKRERSKWGTRINVPELGTAFNKMTLLSLALNWGNEYNRSAVVAGYKELGWTKESVEAALGKYLTARDLHVVNQVWELLDSFWPDIAALQKDMTGLVPDKVEFEPFQIKSQDGSVVEMRGGYYPLKADPKRSDRAAALEEKQSVEDFFGGSWARIMTKQGHTIERQGWGDKAVLLDLSVLTTHVTNVIHDLSHRRAVVDVNKLINNPRLKDAIRRAAGTEMYDVLKPWLRRIAGDYAPPMNGAERAINHLAAGASIVNMGYKVSTALVQPLGYLQTVEVLGPKYSAIGLKRFYQAATSPASLQARIDWVQSKSAQMTTRMNTFDRDVRDQFKALTLGGHSITLHKSFFAMVGMMDMAVAMPTWEGAYAKAMDGNVEGVEAGNDTDAVRYADQVVRMSQSSGSRKDLANVQSGSGVFKLFTTFYSFANALYNQYARRLRMTKSWADMPRFVAGMFLLWFLPAVLSELVAGRGPDDGEDWEDWAKRKAATFGMYPLQSIVLARDVAGGIGEYGYSGGPVGEALADTSTLLTLPFKAAFSDEDVTQQDLKKAWIAASYWGHLPGKQLWITLTGLADWVTGDDVPDDALDAAHQVTLARHKH